MSVPYTELTTQLYFGLGINPTRRTVILAAWGDNRLVCEFTTQERQQNSEMPYEQWKVFPFNDETGTEIKQWLTENGFAGPQIRKIIRSVGRQIGDLLDKAHGKPAGSWQKVKR